MRTTQKQLLARVQMLNHGHGQNIRLEWAYGRPRAYSADGREISPRLPTGQMMVWLDGYLAALTR